MSWAPSPCLGQCDRAPAALIHTAGAGYRNVAPAESAGLTRLAFEELPTGLIHQSREELRLLRRIGHVDPESLESYRGSGGYAGLAKAIDMGRDGLITVLDESGLRGRGGAAFPIGIKWRGVADAEGDAKYVIANGDESEPGTFKDRILMEGDPFAVIEAMTIAGFATGATKGFAFVRGEYPVAERRLTHAIDEAKNAGLLGLDVAGAGFDFEIEVRRGAGAYICGEETALFASIEGEQRRAETEATLPNREGGVWQADLGEQHRDTGGSPGRARDGGGRVRRHRNGALHRSQALLHLGRRDPTRAIRGPVRDQPPPTDDDSPVVCVTAPASRPSWWAAQPGVSSTPTPSTSS